MADEREAIVAWAVQAMPRLLAQNEYTLPESHVQTIREVAQENNSVRFFMEECPKIRVVGHSPEKTSTRTSEDKLYKEYYSFCYGAAGAKAVGQRAFRARMRELQSELDFQLTIETNTMGIQQAFYRSVTLVDGKAG